jgi:hypothetical protein
MIGKREDRRQAEEVQLLTSIDRIHRMSFVSFLLPISREKDFTTNSRNFRNPDPSEAIPCRKPQDKPNIAAFLCGGYSA